MSLHLFYNPHLHDDDVALLAELLYTVNQKKTGH